MHQEEEVIMAPKKKKEEEGEQSMGGIPLGSILDVIDGAGSLFFKYLSGRYRVEKKVEEIKTEANKKAEEIREEAVRTGYAVKKAFLRAVVESILLATGILSLVGGLMLLVRRLAPVEYVLLGYGFLVTLFVAFTVKLSPKE
jgi:hypothetical protein